MLRNDNTPVWMTRSDEQDVIYVRRGGQSFIAHGEQVEELVLSSKRKPFDTQITNKNCSELSFDDLQELNQEKHNNLMVLTLKQLESIDAIDSNQNVSNGLLLFSDNCDYKNCNITCRVWPGLDKGSSKEKLDKYPGHEIKLNNILLNVFPTIVNTPAPDYAQDLTFEKLFIYYVAKGITLKNDTFIKLLKLKKKKNGL